MFPALILSRLPRFCRVLCHFFGSLRTYSRVASRRVIAVVLASSIIPRTRKTSVCSIRGNLSFPASGRSTTTNPIACFASCNQTCINFPLESRFAESKFRVQSTGNPLKAFLTSSYLPLSAEPRASASFCHAPLKLSEATRCSGVIEGSGVASVCAGDAIGVGVMIAGGDTVFDSLNTGNGDVSKLTGGLACRSRSAMVACHQTKMAANASATPTYVAQRA